MANIGSIAVDILLTGLSGANSGLDGLKGKAKGASDALEDTKKSGEGASSTANKLADSVNNTSGAFNVLKAAVVGFLAAFSIQKIAAIADAWSDMQSRIGAATKNMEGAPLLMRRMVDLANSSYSSLEQTVEVYSRNVAVLRDLGKTSSEAADFTESLNHMLVITATRGERAASVQNALSKAMAVGKLQADGLETVLANGGRVAEALAEELGTTVSGLRSMASEGKITGDVIANALLKSLEDVRLEAAEMPATISDAFMRISNNTTALIGTLDKAWGISGAVSENLLEMADAILESTDFFLKLGSIVSSVVGPAFAVLADNADLVGVSATIAAAALAGFFAPAILGGLWALQAAIGTGIVGAIKAVTAAMLANPLGLFIAALAAAITAAFLFRDKIKQAVGIDVVEVVKSVANNIIALFVGAFNAVKEVWGQLPAFFSVLGKMAWNNFIETFEQPALTVNGMTIIPGLDLSAMKAEVTKIDEEVLKPAAAKFDAAFNVDYVGDLADELGKVWETADGAAEALNGLGGGGEEEVGVRAPGAGGGGGGTAAKADAYKKLTESLLENIEAMKLEAETSALSTEEITKQQTALDLLQAARESGRVINAELIEEINTLAASYANASLAVEGAALAVQDPTPWQKAAEEIAALDAALAMGVISWQQYGAAVQKSQMLAASTTLGAVGQITGALASAFQENKAFAIANAVVNTAEGISKALALPFPLNWIQATAVGISGAAQISAISSANPGGGSAPRAPTAPSAPAPRPNDPQRAPSEGALDKMEITVKGLDKGKLFDSETVEVIIKEIIAKSKDSQGLDIRIAS